MPPDADSPYLKLLERIVGDNDDKGGEANRTGVKTLRAFAEHLHFDLHHGFPLLTTKKLHFRSIVHELLWFLKGDTNTAYLKENGVRIWDEWADEDGELGPVYGAQWRSWRDEDGNKIDQLEGLIRTIKTDPYSRRLVVNAWNVGDLKKMALPPCHMLFQFFVRDDELSCQLYQRSADLFLGVPFNIASYALLTHMVAKVTGLRPADLFITFGDVHVYVNHLEQAREQLRRAPRKPPKLHINREVDDLFDFRYEDFRLEDYDPHPHIAAPVAV